MLPRWIWRCCRSADRRASSQVFRPQMYFVGRVVVIESTGLDTTSVAVGVVTVTVTVTVRSLQVNTLLSNSVVSERPKIRTVIVTAIVQRPQIGDLLSNSVVSERPKIRTVIVTVTVQRPQIGDLSITSLFSGGRRSCDRLLWPRAVLVRLGSRGKCSASRFSIEPHIIVRVIGVLVILQSTRA